MSAHAQCPHPFIGPDSQKWANMKHLPEKMFHCKKFLMIDWDSQFESHSLFSVVQIVLESDQQNTWTLETRGMQGSVGESIDLVLLTYRDKSWTSLKPGWVSGGWLVGCLGMNSSLSPKCRWFLKVNPLSIFSSKCHGVPRMNIISSKEVWARLVQA